jgi:hypothetical protein
VDTDDVGMPQRRGQVRLAAEALGFVPETVFRDTVGETDFRDTATWGVGMSYRALVGVSYVLY